MKPITCVLYDTTLTKGMIEKIYILIGRASLIVLQLQAAEADPRITPFKTIQKQESIRSKAHHTLWDKNPNT